MFVVVAPYPGTAIEMWNKDRKMSGIVNTKAKITGKFLASTMDCSGKEALRTNSKKSPSWKPRWVEVLSRPNDISNFRFPTPEEINRTRVFSTRFVYVSTPMANMES
jgi:hypothetical protein